MDPKSSGVRFSTCLYEQGYKNKDSCSIRADHDSIELDLPCAVPSDRGELVLFNVVLGVLGFHSLAVDDYQLSLSCELH